MPEVASARRNEATAFVRMNSVLAANAPKILERVKRSVSKILFHFLLLKQ
jgi:hypothetical protein